MSRNVNWTREQLEMIRDEVKSVAELAMEFDVARGTIYNMRSRISNEGIDAILKGQENRNTERVEGGARAPKTKETLQQQISKVISISAGGSGRGGVSTQYTMTITHLIARAFIEQYGRQVRVIPKDNGLFIEPIILADVYVPQWLEGKDTDEDA